VDEVEQSADAARLIGASGRQQCDALRERIVKHKQERRYRNWYNNRSSSIAYNGLQADGNSADRRTGQEWKAHQDFINTARSWELVVEEIYQSNHGGINSAQTRTTCSRNGTVVTTTLWNFDKKPETARPDTKGTLFGLKYNDSLSLTLQYTTTDFVFANNASGSATWSGSVRDLLRGVSQTIVTSTYGDPIVKLRVTAPPGGIPSQPLLRSPKGDDF
jgi:hypothetical protein